MLLAVFLASCASALVATVVVYQRMALQALPQPRRSPGAGAGANRQAATRPGPTAVVRAGTHHQAASCPSSSTAAVCAGTHHQGATRRGSTAIVRACPPGALDVAGGILQHLVCPLLANAGGQYFATKWLEQEKAAQHAEQQEAVLQRLAEQHAEQQEAVLQRLAEHDGAIAALKGRAEEQDTQGSIISKASPTYMHSRLSSGGKPAHPPGACWLSSCQ